MTKKNKIIFETKEEAVKEAWRYLKNGKETIQKSPIENGRYADSKFVAEGCGIAFIGVLKALDGYFSKQIQRKTKSPNSREYYRELIYQCRNSQIKKILDNNFNEVYIDLHVAGYYNDETSLKIIKDGMKAAKTIIETVENN